MFSVFLQMNFFLLVFTKFHKIAIIWSNTISAARMNAKCPQDALKIPNLNVTFSSNVAHPEQNFQRKKNLLK
jgi:hypothetical protein